MSKASFLLLEQLNDSVTANRHLHRADGAAARLPAGIDVDEPMDVDPHLMDLMKVVMHYSGTNVEDLL